MDFRHQHPVVFESIDEIATRIQDGSTIAIGGFWLLRVPVALVDALVRRGVRNLTIIAHCSGLALEQLIAANLVKKVIFSFSSLDIFGLSPYFRKAIEEGRIEWEEWNALRMMQALDAGRQNLPSAAFQLPLGSMFMTETDEFRVLPCPITGQKLGVTKALQPDVALIHAQNADENGNIQIRGALGVDRLLIGASKATFVSVEEIVPAGAFAPDPRGLIIPRFLINRVCHVPGGAHPTSCMPYYITDYWHLSDAVREAKETGGYDRLMQPAGESLADRIGILREFAQTNTEAFVEKLRNKTGGAISRMDESSAAEDDYTIDELMACVMSAEIRDNMVSTVGSNTPLSMVAYLLAKKTHAPNFVLTPFCGLNDVDAYPITLSLAEVFAFERSTSHWAIEDLWQWIYQKSLTAIEFGSPAQIDLHGRINNSIIGSPDKIKVRLPGQAGLADVLNLHHHCYLYVSRQDRRRLVERVDWSSGARELLTKEEREAAGLPDGTYKVFTNFGIFEMDRERRTLVLTDTHPGVTLEEVQAETGFPLEVADPLRTTAAPTRDQLHLIRKVIDPFGFRKLEFASAAERGELIRDMLDREQQLLFGEARLEFK